MKTDPFLVLLAKTRRRLVLEALSAAVPPALWACAGVAAVFAALPVKTMPLAGAALILPVAVFAVAVSRRWPARVQAARRADQCFGLASLLTTACECRTRRVQSPAAKLVIEQASNAASRLLAEERLAWRLPQARQFVLPVVPLFVALLILYGGTFDDAEAPAAALARGGAPVATPDPLPGLRSALAGGSEPMVRERADAPVPAVAASTVPSDVPADTVETDDGMPGGQRVPGNGTDPGSAPRNGSPARAATEDAPELPRRALNLERAGDGFGRGESRASYANGKAVRYGDTPAVPPAAAPPRATTRLTETELSYARRYLAAADERHD